MSSGIAPVPLGDRRRMAPGRRARHRRCFTLVEVLATLVLIGIVLPVALHGISLATRAASMTKRSLEAAALAEMKLNELVATNQWAMGNSGGDFGEEWPDYRWQAEYVSRDTNLMELSVHVTWKQRNIDESVTLSTWVYTGSQ